LDESLDDEAEGGLSFAHCTHAGAEEVISHLSSCTCADREAHCGLLLSLTVAWKPR
jgi:hypothetical protein